MSSEKKNEKEFYFYFWVMASEVMVHVQLAVVFMSSGEAKHGGVGYGGTE